jgi:hypothetical protein
MKIASQYRQKATQVYNDAALEAKKEIPVKSISSDLYVDFTSSSAHAIYPLASLVGCSSLAIRLPMTWNRIQESYEAP